MKATSVKKKATAKTEVKENEILLMKGNEEQNLRKIIEDSEKRYNKMLMQSPFAFAVLKGKDMVVAIANDSIKQMWGKGNEIEGKPLIEILPEIKDQEFPALLHNVYSTGNPYVAKEAPARVKRNGKMEDLYFNFVYQPYRETDDTILGVTIIAIEVTNEVIAKKKIKANEEQLQNILLQAPAAIAVFDGPQHRFIMANQAYQKQNNRTEKDFLGKRFLEVFPELEGTGSFEIFDNVYITGETFTASEYAAMIDSDNNGIPKQSYFNFSLEALKNESKEIYGVMVMAYDITKQVEARIIIEESEKRYNRILMQSPFAFSIMKGKDMVITHANDLMKDFWGKGNDVEEKTLLEVLPELKDQPFPQMLDSVYATGKPISANEILVLLNRHGIIEEHYFNLTCQPSFEADGTISSVITIAHEVTEQVLIRKKIEESEVKYKSLIGAAPIGIGLLMGRDLILESANQKYIDLIGKGNDIEGKKFTAIMPELVGQPYLKILDDIFITGKSYHSFADPVSVIRNGLLRHEFYDIDYAPLFDGGGKVYAILNIATDVTIQTQLNINVKESEKRFKNVLLHSPNIFMILESYPEMIITFANEPLFKSWGRTAAIIGKPLLEVVPEIKDQPFPKLLQRVFETGETYYNSEEKAEVIKNGVTVDIYFDFVYQPIFDDTRKVTGVTVMATDITAQVTARKKIEDSEERQAFLLRFSDTLREESNVDAIANRALQMLSGHLKLDRCYIGVYQLAEDRGVFPYQVGNERVPPVPASLRLSDFPDALRVAFDRTLVIDDITKAEDLSDTDRQNLGALGMCALVAATLRHGEANPLWSIVVVSASPRHWTLNEVTLIEEVTERTWAAVERAKGEYELRKTEEQLRAVLEQAPLAIAITGTQGDIQFSNTMFDVLWGRPAHETEASKYSQVYAGFHLDGKPIESEEWPGSKALMKGKVVIEEVLEIVHLSGQKIPCSFNAGPIRSQDGTIVGAVVMFHDVTAEQTTKMQLQESEEKYRSLFNSIQDAFCIIELLFDEKGEPIDWIYVETNPAFLKHATVEMKGKRISEFVPEVEAVWLEQYGRVVKTGVPVQVEHFVKGLGNQWFQNSAFRHGLESSNRIAVLFRNITEQKAAEEKIAESEKQLALDLADSQILQTFSTQIIHEENIDLLYEQLVDAAIALVHSDMASIQLYHPEKKQLELLAYKGFHPESAAHWKWINTDSKSVCSVAMSNGERSIVSDLEKEELTAKTGGLNYYQLSGIRAMQSTPLISRSGDLIGMISTHWREPHQPSERKLQLFDVLARRASDLIDRKKTEDKLREAKVFAENAVKFKQQFLSNMSQEIRTPLNSILGFANVLLKTKLDAEQKEFLQAVITSGHSLNLLINDILDLAKVDAGKMTFVKQPFEIRKSIEAILYSFDLKIKEKNLKLIKEYDSKIPSILLGDSVRLNQIILNLISNAVKFTHKGKIIQSVKLLHEDEENVNIEFTVTDTGIGIAANKIN